MFLITQEQVVRAWKAAFELGWSPEHCQEFRALVQKEMTLEKMRSNQGKPEDYYEPKQGSHYIKSRRGELKLASREQIQTLMFSVESHNILNVTTGETQKVSFASHQL